MRDEGVGLEYYRRAALEQRQVGDVAVMDKDVAVRDDLVTGDHAQRAGLAAAARAEQAARGEGAGGGASARWRSGWRAG